MRARLGLALALEELGHVEMAAGRLRELLRLNPNDNHGAREILVGLLFDMKTDDELFALLSQYEDSCSAEWTYTWALAEFRRDGDNDDARQRLKEAVRWNKHMPAYDRSRNVDGAWDLDRATAPRVLSSDPSGLYERGAHRGSG